MKDLYKSYKRLRGLYVKKKNEQKIIAVVKQKKKKPTNTRYINIENV